MTPVSLALVAACPFPSWQGSQVLLREMAEQLVRRGHDVHVLAYGYGEYQAPGEYRLHRIPDISIGRSFRSGPRPGKLVHDLLLAGKLIALVRRHGIKLIHAHNCEAVMASYPASQIFDIPLIYHSHTILARELHTYTRSKMLRGMWQSLGRLIDRLSLAAADHVIAISHEEEEYFTRLGTPPGTITRIEPGTTLAEADLEGGEDENTSICYQGNLDRYQDLGTLFAAVRRAGREIPELRLEVVTRSDWTEWKRLAERSGIGGRVRFTKPRTIDQALGILRRSRMAVITRNVRSGFPIKLLNYMACGKAILATKSAGTIFEHGTNAWLVEDGDDRALAEGICTLFRNGETRARLGSGARALAREHFSWSLQISRIEHVYGRLLKGVALEETT